MEKRNLDKELENSLNKLVKTDYEDFFPTFASFALQLESGQIIYIFQIYTNVESRFNFFLNEDQYLTFEKYVKNSQYNNRLKHAENFFSQDYVSVQMPGFPDDDLDDYAGPFQRYLPHKLPSKVEGKEAEQLIEILNTLARFQKSKVKNQGNLYRELPVINGRGVIPLIIPEKDKFKIDLMAIDFDVNKEEEYKDLIFEDEILLSKLKQNSYKGDFAIELIYGSVPIIVQEVGPDPFFINGMLVYDYMTECMEPIGCKHDYLDEPEEFLHDFAEDLLSFELLPNEVHIRDKKTLSIVKDLFEKLNVRIVFEEEIPELDAAEDEIFDLERNQQELTQEDVDELGEVLTDLVDMDLPFSKRLVNNYYKFNEILKEERGEEEEITESSNNVIDFNDIRSFEYKATITDLGEFRVIAPSNENLQDLIIYILENIDYDKKNPDWNSDYLLENNPELKELKKHKKTVEETYTCLIDDNKKIKLEILSSSPNTVNEILIEPME